MTETYCRYWYPGLVLAEDHTERVKSRDPETHAKNADIGCYGFEYYDIDVETINGRELRSKPYNYSGMYYIGGILMDIDDQRLGETARFNLEQMDTRTAIRTRRNTIQPFYNDRDRVISCEP